MSTDTGGAAILAGALNLTLPELVFPDVDELFQRRVRMLEKFCRPGLAESLVSAARDSIEATRMAHLTCNRFASIAETIASLPRDAASLFILASINLDREAESTPDDAETLEIIGPEAMAETKQRLSLARKRILDAVMSNLQTGDGSKTLRDILNECLVGADELTSLELTTQTTLLASKQRQLQVVVDTLPELARLAMIWRGLFYAAVIGKAGGSLEKELVRQKVMEAVTEASWKIPGIVPGVGDLIDVARTLIRFYTSMRDKEDHVDEFIDQLQLAQEFIDTYRATLMLWAASANPVREALVTFIDAFAK